MAHRLRCVFAFFLLKHPQAPTLDHARGPCRLTTHTVLAELFPNAQVIGTDLSQIQPDQKPPNVTFVREDSEEEWCYDFRFDYIHARAVVTCFDNPKGVMEKAFQNLNPGGYIEYLDCYGVSGCLDGTLKGTALERLGGLCVQGAAASGRDLMVATRYKEWLEEIGCKSCRGPGMDGGVC